MLQRLLRDYEYAIDSIRRWAIIEVAQRYLKAKEYRQFLNITKQLVR